MYDPINDLAERFSWVMLVSTASLGIQRILMEMSETIYARFLSDHYQEASQTLTHISEELSQVDPTGPVNGDTAPSANRLQEIRRWLAETTDWSDMRKKIVQLGAKLERFTADAVHLMVVFILQTILIPLLTLWLLTKSLTIRHALPGPKEPSED